MKVSSGRKLGDALFAKYLLEVANVTILFKTLLALPGAINASTQVSFVRVRQASIEP